MRLAFILLVCLCLGCSDNSAKPIRVEIEETIKPRRKRVKGTLMNLLYLQSKVRVV